MNCDQILLAISRRAQAEEDVGAMMGYHKPSELREAVDEIYFICEEAGLTPDPIYKPIRKATT